MSRMTASLVLPAAAPVAAEEAPAAAFPASQLWPIRWQLYLGLLALAVGGLIGLLQALERVAPQVYPTSSLYYQGLTLHGVLLALVFTFTFAMGFLSLMTMQGFGRPLASTRLHQGAWWLGLTGVLLAGIAMLTNQASVLYTFYAPLQASPLFYLGAALLVVATWAVALNLAITVVQWKRAHPGEKIPLLAFASVATFLMWVIASLGIAVEVVGILIPWSAGLFPGVDPELNRTLFWFSGHAIVYFWLLPAYVSWYLLIPCQVGGKIYSDGLTRFVFILFLVFSVPTGLHHQFTDPGITLWMKAAMFFTTMLIFFPSVITAFSLMAALEMAGRGRGGRGLLGWIPKLPWGDPSVTAQLLAMLVFLVGGITGLINASYTVNLVVHNTAFIVGHFHMTVGTAVALTIMGICYWLVPYLTGHALWGRRVALVQAWLWAIGVLIFARGQIAGGLAGQPRRTAIGAAAYAQPSWALDNGLTAAGGVLMTVSGALFFLVIMVTIFRAVPAAVAIPESTTVVGPRETWPVLDRLGVWFVVALMPFAFNAPGWQVWGNPTVPWFWRQALWLAAALVTVSAFVAFWRQLQRAIS